MADYEVEFTDNSVACKKAIENVCISWLEEVGGEIESQASRKSRNNTGQLKGSWKHVVDKGKLECTIGSPLQNAIWEEFGTGEYALKGNGRKTPWHYKDIKGKWHTTTGKKPNRALYMAFETTKARAQSALKVLLKGLK